MIQLCEPLVDGMIGFMDGVSFTSECTDKRVMLNAMYCGCDCDTMINTFAYGHKREVSFYALNPWKLG